MRQTTYYAPLSLYERLCRISQWERRSLSDVQLMLLGFGLEVYAAMLAEVSGKVLVPEGLEAVPTSAALVEAIGRARLVEQAKAEILKRNREWLLEREIPSENG